MWCDMMCTLVAILMENIGVAAMCCYDGEFIPTTPALFVKCTRPYCTVISVQYTLYTILAYYHIILFYKGYAIRQCNHVIQCISVKCSHSWLMLLERIVDWHWLVQGSNKYHSQNINITHISPLPISTRFSCWAPRSRRQSPSGQIWGVRTEYLGTTCRSASSHGSSRL